MRSEEVSVSVSQTGQLDLSKFRVWPDGTVQPVEDAPYDWMSDDFMIVVAADRVEASIKVNLQPR